MFGNARRYSAVFRRNFQRSISEVDRLVEEQESLKQNATRSKDVDWFQTRLTQGLMNGYRIRGRGNLQNICCRQTGDY